MCGFYFIYSWMVTIYVDKEKFCWIMFDLEFIGNHRPRMFGEVSE